MLSFFTNPGPARTTLVFPDDQKLWRFFADTDLSVFRIESANHTIAGKFDRDKIELARERFGAVVVRENAGCSETPALLRQLHCLFRAACALF